MMNRSRLVAVALLLALCLPTFLFGGGWVEDKDVKTVVHVMTAVLPDPVDISTYAQAEAAGVKRFKEEFPGIFRQRYRDRYRADPAKYGRHNWDDVEVQLHLPTGIKVEGVEADLLQIAGGWRLMCCMSTFGNRIPIFDPAFYIHWISLKTATSPL